MADENKERKINKLWVVTIVVAVAMLVYLSYSISERDRNFNNTVSSFYDYLNSKDTKANVTRTVTVSVNPATVTATESRTSTVVAEKVVTTTVTTTSTTQSVSVPTNIFGIGSTTFTGSARVISLERYLLADTENYVPPLLAFNEYYNITLSFFNMNPSFLNSYRTFIILKDKTWSIVPGDNLLVKGRVTTTGNVIRDLRFDEIKIQR